MKRMSCISCVFMVVLSTMLILPSCMTVSDKQPNFQGSNSSMFFGNRRIAVLPVKAQTSLAPDSVMALRNELNKRIGTTLRSKLPSSIITDMSVVADRLSQTGDLTIFEQLVSTYENTGVIDKRHSAALGSALGSDYLLLSRLKAEKMDLGISRGMGASLEIMLISANTGEVAWGGSGEWKRGGIFGAGKTSADEAAENLLTLAFDGLQSRGDAPVVEKTVVSPIQEKANEVHTPDAVPDRKGDNKLVVEMQKRLLKLGYDPGLANGKMGKKTIEALKKFQQDNNLPITGQTDHESMDKLRNQTKKTGGKSTRPSLPDTEAPPASQSPPIAEVPLPTRPSPPVVEAPQPTRPSPPTAETPQDSAPIKVRSVMDL